MSSTITQNLLVFIALALEQQATLRYLSQPVQEKKNPLTEWWKRNASIR
jgi:hypothetical protein